VQARQMRETRRHIRTSWLRLRAAQQLCRWVAGCLCARSRKTQVSVWQCKFRSVAVWAPPLGNTTALQVGGRVTVCVPVRVDRQFRPVRACRSVAVASQVRVCVQWQCQVSGSNVIRGA